MSTTARLMTFAAALLIAAGLLAAPPAQAATPPTPTTLPTAIEPLANYVQESSCEPVAKAGTLKLARMLVATYPSTYATTYDCGTDGTRSEHYDGRAIDWMVSVRNTTQRSYATAAINWLLATDTHGNTFMRARRLGIQYVIWNNQMWGSWSGKWEPYENCATLTSTSYDSMCHRNHVHISLSWNGALGLTSFWTSQVAKFDYGPCRPRDLNWAPNRRWANASPCPSYATAHAPAGSSMMKVVLYRWSGMELKRDMRGPAVTALQQALRVPATGVYDLTTAVAVVNFQHAHGMNGTGIMLQPTWRALLTAVK